MLVSLTDLQNCTDNKNPSALIVFDTAEIKLDWGWGGGKSERLGTCGSTGDNKKK